MVVIQAQDKVMASQASPLANSNSQHGIQAIDHTLAHEHKTLIMARKVMVDKALAPHNKILRAQWAINLG
jgi:hypothetical protein